ncbi:fatty acid desaturase family protein [Roseateles sp. SL47]|uniref:fatty acid desaturase family protein n=1 Tax=Roseateles sp. SL47 TaxID=2995138 RepID=UPI00226D4198|nr:fatty acid desaturase family protein [Roseateles sp. SL47]WAC71670.1 fatty acid desaturase family protein [Roseateles sp. SL47]
MSDTVHHPEGVHHRRFRVDPRLHTDLRGLRPWICAAQITTQWLVCSLAIATAEHLHHWYVTLPVLMVIATRQHALLVLMHDAAHGLISRRRWLNDLIGHLLLSFPMTVSVARYRRHHLLHHRHLNQSLDPDRTDSILPASRSDFLRLLLRDVTGLTTLTTLRSANHFGMLGLFSANARGSLQDRLLAVFFLLGLVLTLWAGGWGWQFLLYWIAPMLLFLPALLRVRGIAEHGGRLDHPADRNARSIRPGWLERLVWAPCHIHLHWEHHSCPAVPSYNLPRLSRRLVAAYPASEAAQALDGYFLGRRSLLNDLFPRADRARPEGVRP